MDRGQAMCRGGRATAGLTVLVSAAVVLCGVPAAGAAAAGPMPSPGALPADAAAAPLAVRDSPDVALIMSGGTGRTAVMRSGEPSFARLWQLLQPSYTGTELVPQEWAEGRYPPVRLTVVWALTGVGGWPQTLRPPEGDVALRRQDQLFVAEDGTPWVRSDPAPEVEDDDIRWHRAPRGVYEHLERTGRFGSALAAETPSGGGSAVGRGRTAEGVWWAVNGLAVGVGGSFLIRRAAARREAGPPREEPRQELIDL